jgi:hypothetical protein
MSGEQFHLINFARLTDLATTQDPSVKLITLDFPLIMQVAMDVFIKALKNNPQIYTVTAPIKPQGRINGLLVEFIKDNKTLRSLSLQLTDDFNLRSAQELAHAINENTHLQELCLIRSVNNIVDLAPIRRFIKTLSKRQTPIALSLINMRIFETSTTQERFFTSEIIEDLGAAKLTALSLINSEIKDAEAKKIFSALEYSSTLEILDISENMLTDACDLERLVLDFPGRRLRLKELHCGNNQLGDITAQRLADALTTNPSLKVLDIRNNKLITPMGIKTIFSALANNRTLRELDLSDIFDVTSEVIEVLKTASIENPPLLKIADENDEDVFVLLWSAQQRMNAPLPVAAAILPEIPPQAVNPRSNNDDPLPPAKKTKLTVETILEPSTGKSRMSISNLLATPQPRIPSQSKAAPKATPGSTYVQIS